MIRGGHRCAPVTPGTVTGVAEFSNVPSPSCPALSPPQHLTCPPATIAHEWFTPAATAVAPATPDTVTGVRETSVVPLPSCPASL